MLERAIEIKEILEVVESYGPLGDDLNDNFRYQIILAEEVKRLYEAARMIEGRANHPYVSDAVKQELLFAAQALRELKPLNEAALRLPRQWTMKADEVMELLDDASADAVSFWRAKARYFAEEILRYPSEPLNEAEPVAKQEVLCHAQGDRCHGCPHYYGKADVCSFAIAAPVSNATEEGAKKLTFSFDEMMDLLDLFGNDNESLVCVQEGNGHAGLGKYAWHPDYPDGGGFLLGMKARDAQPLPVDNNAGAEKALGDTLLDMAGAELERLRKALEEAKNGLQSIVEVHDMHCEHHVGVSKHSYDLANMAAESLVTVAMTEKDLKS